MRLRSNGSRGALCVVPFARGVARSREVRRRTAKVLDRDGVGEERVGVRVVRVELDQEAIVRGGAAVGIRESTIARGDVREGLLEALYKEGEVGFEGARVWSRGEVFRAGWGVSQTH